MNDAKHSLDDSDESFDLDWESLTFSSAPAARADSDSFEDWEDRLGENTAGYVANSATTSFTDLDLESAQIDLRGTPEWADLASFTDD